MSRIFLTGGMGFVGRHVAAELARRGHEVSRLVRNAADAARSDSVGDIRSRGSYAPALNDVDVVVHLAAVTGKAKREDYFRVNDEGTRELLAAISESRRPPRLIFVSTIAVRFGDLNRYPYAQSKLAAERHVAASGLPAVIVRPTIVAGAGSPVMEGLARMASLPILPAFDGAKARVQPVMVKDLASAIADIAGSAEWDGQTIEIGGPAVTTIRELVVEIRRASGRSAGFWVTLQTAMVLPVIGVLDALVGPAVPITAGQIATFRFDGTASPSRFLSERISRMTGLDVMIRESISGA